MYLSFVADPTEARQKVVGSSPWCGPYRTGANFEQGVPGFTEKAGDDGAESDPKLTHQHC